MGLFVEELKNVSEETTEARIAPRIEKSQLQFLDINRDTSKSETEFESGTPTFRSCTN